MSGAEDVAIRSLFKQLREAEMISIIWADDIPYHMAVLGDGLSYFEELCMNDQVQGRNIYTNNFYGRVDGIQIQLSIPGVSGSSAIIRIWHQVFSIIYLML